ncbi:MAG: hypothetical protein IJ496_07940 [Ruminococcus sp.]|nr:hypothetical protein [Ruminococcus sp.]
MARFCSKCGTPLNDGQICPCQMTQNTGYTYPNSSTFNPTPQTEKKAFSFQVPAYDISSPRNFWASLKDNMGVGDPEANRDQCYETGMKIVPENLKANDGEIPVKQYRFATLRSRAAFMKAKGRMQITNKRLIFRAPGRSPAGRTLLQYEFDVNEIHGIRVQKGHRFSFWNLIIHGLLIALISYLMLMAFTESESVGLIVTFSVLFGLAGLGTFFLVKKKFFLKWLLCEITALLSYLSSSFSDTEVFWLVIACIFLVFTLISIFLHCFCPDMQFLVDTTSGTPAMIISRERGKGLFGRFGHEAQVATGYREVLPAEDTEKAIRELNSIISDLQTMGDLAVEKWKQD